MAKKSDAITSLTLKSRSLSKAIEPRRAYRFAPKNQTELSNGFHLRTMTDFSKGFDIGQGHGPSQPGGSPIRFVSHQPSGKERDSIAPGGDSNSKEA